MSAHSPASTRHISSAVVTALPAYCDEIARHLAGLPDTEVHYVENGKIVIVLEGHDSGEIGGRVAAIALFDGVVSANLVFEQIDTLDERGAGP
ncbi:MAG: chaperone NapD [Stellaceae bacterium]